MRHGRRLKALLAGLVVTLSLVVPAALILGAPAAGTPVDDPMLYFDGLRMQLCEDGSVQLLIDVAVEGVSRWSGVSLRLNFNRNLLVPSDFDSNIALPGGDTRAFFRTDPALYKPGLPSPFDEARDSKISFSDSGGSFGQLYMEVMMRHPPKNSDPSDWLELDGSKLEIYEPESGSIEDDEILYMVNTTDTPNSDDPTAGPHDGGLAHGKTVIGTLSFRAKAKDIPAIFALYGGIVDQPDPKGKDGSYLVDVPRSGGGVDLSAWFIHYYQSDEGKEGVPYSYFTYESKALFTLGVDPSEVISVEPLEKAVAVNAYQAYSTGTEADIPLTLQKFGPMVTVTYADGRREHKIMPWGSAAVEADYTARLYDDAPIGTYDPTGVIDGSDPTKPDYDYKISQYYTWEVPDGAGGTTTRTFPIPVEVTLEVQEIRLLGFTSEHLERTYTITPYLPTLAGGSAGLGLPDFARVITDIPPGNNSMLMPIPGWRSANPDSQSTWPNASEMNKLYADASASGAVYWPVSSDVGPVGAHDPAKHIGTYSFEMAESNGGAKTNFIKEDVERAFPWLTTPPQLDPLYQMSDARRTLADAASFSDTADYTAKYVSTEESGNGTPILTLSVARAGSNDMTSPAAFRILMPDGTEIVTSVAGTWFDPVAMASYVETLVPATNDYYTLEIGTGLPEVGDFGAQREALRRHINLGGYFFVAVQEGVKTWSDFMPVYVPPRANRHTGDALYNFLGVNARLFNYPGALGTVITVPQGEYHPVNEDGLPLYTLMNGGTTADPSEMDVTGLHTERFGVPTTYDGLTGAEPGRLYTFEVDGTADKWPDPVPGVYPGGTYDLYGPDTFVNGRIYSAYGRVVNPGLRTATVRLEQERDEIAPDEKIKVTYLGTSSSVNMDADGHLVLAKYDNRTVGYTDRQDYEFVIINEGDTDIYDLAIFNHTFDAAIGGGHFVVTRPPAAFLPAGGTTTFTLTYVYDLPANGTTLPEYRDTLYVTSSSRPSERLDTGDADSYLATFDASFAVKTAAQHRIIFDMTPAPGIMGDAAIIVGEETDDPYNPTERWMNYDPGSNRAEASKDGKANVYFTVTLNDPYYVIDTIEALDASENPVILAQYTSGTGTGAAVLDSDKGAVYSFVMPDYDVTITIRFKESLQSKLRLHDGWIWASPDNVHVNTAGSTMEKYALYQKEFTAAEKAATGEANEKLMMVGRATDKGIDPQNYHYLSVIPNEARYIQVEVLLRQVLAVVADNKPLKNIVVTMTLFDSNGIKSTVEYIPDKKGIIYDVNNGQTNPPTPPSIDGYDHHLCQVINGPGEDQSIYVVVALSGKEDDSPSSAIYPYYFEIHRAPKRPVVTYRYGNAPYGLIMNAAETDIPAADKAKAKAAFVENKYCFDGLAANLVPDAAVNGGMAQVHYWSEAWVKPGGLYEPETGTGMTSLGSPPVYDTSVYDPAENLDLDDYALFVQAGKPFDEPGLKTLFDSSGRAVDLDADKDMVTCTAEVTLLDGTAVSLVGRYSMPDPALPGSDATIARRTALLDMGMQAKAGTTGWWSVNAQVQKLDALGDPDVDADGNKIYEPLTGTFHLRPGVYELVYTYTDFDGESTLTVTRPLVVLSPVGDVNGNHLTENTDRTDLQKRVGSPLGYDGAVTFYQHTNLYRFRVCDVNNDRNINNIDANQLKSTPRNAYYIFTGYRST